MGCYGIFRGPVGPIGPTGPAGPTGPTAIGQSYIQQFGAASLSNISGATVLNPCDWEANVTNFAASTNVSSLFPNQGGTIETLSLYYIVAALAVDVVWTLNVNGVDSALTGVILSGSQGMLYVTGAIAIASGLANIKIKCQPAAAPGSSIIRVRAVLTGYLNPP